MVTKKSDKPPARRTAVKRTTEKKPRNIWRELSAIGNAIPPAERAALPRDGARNLDRYLDGSPRED
jgi:hypothetical protein